MSPIHFLSSWDVEKAHDLGLRLIKAGANVNAIAKRGPSIGGTPLMWAVYGGHLEHARILMEFGAQPMISTDDHEDALSFAARLHSATFLQYLLEYTRPIQVRGHISRLAEAALGGESRFKRMTRHGERWITAAGETLQLLKHWHALFPEAENFTIILLPALRASLKTPYGMLTSDSIVPTLLRDSFSTILFQEALSLPVWSLYVFYHNGILNGETNCDHQQVG